MRGCKLGSTDLANATSLVRQPAIWVAKSNVLTLPAGARLSHVEKHVDEETVVPCSAFELAPPRGLCIWMSASNVECKSPQDGEVGGSVIFSASRLILVENDVERPVQNIFDAPMFANDAQQFCGRVALGQKEVAGRSCRVPVCW
jgi:hypothetical protein